MQASFLVPDQVMKRLATLANELDGHESEVEQALAEIPASVVDAALDVQLETQWRLDDRLRLLALLAHDARSYVRAQVAMQLGELTPPWPAALLQRLCADDDVTVRH